MRSTPLERLRIGNQRFSENRLETPNQTTQRRLATLNAQAPFAVILTCSDSRVIPELIFDCGIGDLFVVRIAGNIATTEAIASIEFAVSNLGTNLVVVLGHESCVAVSTAKAGGSFGENLKVLVSHIQPAIEHTKNKELEVTIKQNAQLAADQILSASSVISKSVKTNNVSVIPAYYSFQSGLVEFLK